MPAFRNILVDIDATAAAHPATQAAFDLAARFGARVTLVDVIPELPPGARNVISLQAEQELADDRLSRLQGVAAGRPDLRIETAVLHGKPAVALVRQVLRADHDLVVRSHARDLVPGRLFGAVDTQLLRNCPCPVWLIGPEAAADAPHILAAVDPESSSPDEDDLNRRILDLALALGETRNARITALHAWSLFGEEMLRPRLGDERMRALLEVVEGSARQRLGELIASLGVRAARVHPACVKGEPELVIPRFAAAEKVDLVVMGTVARTGIAGIVTGNTAERVLRALRGSVLAIKPRGFVSPVTRPDESDRTAAA